MPSKIRIKPEFKDRVIGYNGRSLPLGKRDDYDVLAKIAKNSGDPSLLEVFEEVPGEAVINARMTEKTIKSIKAVSDKQAEGNYSSEKDKK